MPSIETFVLRLPWPPLAAVETSSVLAEIRDLLIRGRDQFWIHAGPDDADDWAGQLFLWIEEEVATGGLGTSRARVLEPREESDVESYVIAEA